MNYSTAVMLINPNIRAVKTIYQPDTDKSKTPRIVFKTLDRSIAKGDFVIVPTDTRHGMTVVQVDEVDVDIDFESDVQVKWIIDRVTRAESDHVLAEEGKWISELKASEKRAAREKVKENMMAMYKDTGIAQLAIAHMSDGPATTEQQKEI